MQLAVTGAGGFVGRTLARHLADSGYAGRVRLFDRAFDQPMPFGTVAVDLCEPEGIAAVVDGADCVIHLAALPGAAAQADPRLSRRVNLGVPLDLIERMGGRRLIYASSIAVYGSDWGERVDEDTAAAPSSTYGTHKRMVELAFADAVRRGDVRGIALRLPGIVARPSPAGGFGSSFLSEMFHAAAAGEAYCVPVAPDATSWLMSARVCARNLLHAALGDANEAEAITMPALRVSVGDLVEELDKAGNASRFHFREDPALRRDFGSLPPLTSARADAMGFRSDGDVQALVANAMADVKADRATHPAHHTAAL